MAAWAKSYILPWVDNILSRMIFYFRFSSWVQATLLTISLVRHLPQDRNRTPALSCPNLGVRKAQGPTPLPSRQASCAVHYPGAFIIPEKFSALMRTLLPTSGFSLGGGLDPKRPEGCLSLRSTIAWVVIMASPKSTHQGCSHHTPETLTGPSHVLTRLTEFTCLNQEHVLLPKENPTHQPPAQWSPPCPSRPDPTVPEDGGLGLASCSLPQAPGLSA